MDQINVPDKIHFHKKTSEVLYYDLLHSTLNTKKLQTRVEKLEEQLKKEKAMSKAWQTQVMKLEANLLAKGIQPRTKQPIKKLLEEKDKTIQSLKKKLKILVTDHPQTEELLVLQRERDSYQEEVLNLKAKILQFENEKEQL
jgi:molecular chaperone DnaK (HSP70)